MQRHRRYGGNVLRAEVGGGMSMASMILLNVLVRYNVAVDLPLTLRWHLPCR